MSGRIPLPGDFRLSFDRYARRPRREVLIGGSPLRVLRLTDSGANTVDRWLRGEPVGAAPAQGLLARRLVDAGVAHPRPRAGSGPAWEDVTVVIPVRDREAGLSRTLATLAGCQVVVVDDGSIDPINVPGVRLVRHDTSLGPAAARNTGWREAAPDGQGVVVFIDADCGPKAGWLDALLDHFADPLVGAVAPRIRSLPGRGLLDIYEESRTPLDLGPSEGPVGPGSRVPYVPSACLAVRRAALECVGGFDEDFRFGEDVDLVWRLEQAGWRIRYEPAAEVFHPPRRSLKAWLRQRFEYGLSAGQLAERHGKAVAPAAGSRWSGACWALVVVGQPSAAVILALLSSGWISAGSAREHQTAQSLMRVALRGHLVAGASYATAVRRAWLPVALVVLRCTRAGRSRRRMLSLLAVAFAVPPATWFSKRPGLGLISWTALRWADDLAYQSGLWAGILKRRSLKAWAALVPRI